MAQAVCFLSQSFPMTLAYRLALMAKLRGACLRSVHRTCRLHEVRSCVLRMPDRPNDVSDSDYRQQDQSVTRADFTGTMTSVGSQCRT